MGRSASIGVEDAEGDVGIFVFINRGSSIEPSMLEEGGITASSSSSPATPPVKLDRRDVGGAEPVSALIDEAGEGALMRGSNRCSAARFGRESGSDDEGGMLLEDPKADVDEVATFEKGEAVDEKLAKDLYIYQAKGVSHIISKETYRFRCTRGRRKRNGNLVWCFC